MKMTRALRPIVLGCTLLGASGAATACGPEPFIGQICTVAFDFCPKSYAAANGALLPVNQYQALFALLGNTYGGDGRTNFALPDLRGRTAVGTGPGPGLTPVALAQARGSESVTLQVSQLPSAPVSVSVQALQGNATKASPETGDLLAITNSGGRDPVQSLTYAPSNATGTKVDLGGVSGTLAGGNTPVSTLPPQLGLTVCIATQGLFPTRP